jgi:NTP pyrophosphatase (non-canonical NTP hydrolase)
MTDLSFDDYQDETDATAVYPHEYRFPYLALGLSGEAGEVAGTIKKYIRDGLPHDEVKERVMEEVGDVLWYCSQLLFEFGIKFSDCAEHNLVKLLSRQRRGVIQGDGDHR